ncbi:MAG: Gfo/Idh/MocA family oxidoreductase [Lachnospiraceae bacterium]|nr:Gfo/Idh/MocA family oxidoreductase [Lachnospiraceae bacterium]
MQVNLGIVGVGDFGRMHIQALKQNPEVQIIAVCSRTEEKLKSVCEEYKIPAWYTDVDAFLKHPHLDGVIIATGEDTHYPFTRKAVEQGKHVLLEKPVCLTKEDAGRLLALNKTTPSVILPGHILRYDSAYNQAKQALEETQAGEIQSIRVKRNVPVERFSLHSRTHPVFMALAHDIDIILWLTGSQAKRVFAMEKKTKPEFENPDIVFALAELENGVVCSLETQWRLPNEYGRYLDTELEVMTSKGNVKLQTPGNALQTMFLGCQTGYDVTLWPEVCGKMTGALVNEEQHFVDLILGRCRKPVVTVEEAVKGVTMAQMILESCKTKMPVWRGEEEL